MPVWPPGPVQPVQRVRGRAGVDRVEGREGRVQLEEEQNAPVRLRAHSPEPHAGRNGTLTVLRPQSGERSGTSSGWKTVQRLVPRSIAIQKCPGGSRVSLRLDRPEAVPVGVAGVSECMAGAHPAIGPRAATTACPGPR